MLSSANFELIGWHSKNTLDVFWIPDAYLNVGLLVETGGFVDRLSFQKNTPYGIKFQAIRSFVHVMNVIHNSTIQMAQK